MRKSPMKVIALSIAAVSFLAACGSDSDSSSEEVTVDSAFFLSDESGVC
jgi:ABC-type glycerol-3-phosphate transport system substrate-binding protein